MNYKEKCECCQQQITAYTHNLNKPLVNALRQLVDFYQGTQIDHRITGNFCNLARNLKLTHNQLANFQKLRYFDLVFNNKDGWVPTQLGIDFIHGLERVYSPVATFKNEKLPFSHEAWKTHKGAPILVGVKDIDETSYKPREEYQQEKSNQANLF